MIQSVSFLDKIYRLISRSCFYSQSLCFVGGKSPPVQGVGHKVANHKTIAYLSFTTKKWHNTITSTVCREVFSQPNSKKLMWSEKSLKR
jgi:hypothetical protein